MKRARQRKAAACLTALALVSAGLSLFPPRVTAQRDDPSDGVELRPGLLIHPTRDEAYVMTPEGIAAVDLRSGAKRWTSRAASLPLALAGDRLISQVEPKTATRLELVALNVRQLGEPEVRGATELPSDIRVSVGESLAGQFLIKARPTADSVDVTWSFQPIPRRGMPEIPADVDGDEPVDTQDTLLIQRRVRPRASGGALRMSLRTGAVARQDAAVPAIMPPQRQAVALIEKIPNAAPAQYESADGRHVVTSERVGDDRVWDKYRWTVYERSTGRRLGEFRTHVAFTPFVVRGSLVLFETTPFIRRGVGQEPAKLRAVDLNTGREAWAVQVREIIYRGPAPP